MNNKERIEKIKNSKYQEIFGVTKDFFDKMLNCLVKAYKQLHLQGGRPSKLSVLDKLTLFYYREYRTTEHIGFDVSESTVCESVQWEKSIYFLSRFSLAQQCETVRQVKTGFLW